MIGAANREARDLGPIESSICNGIKMTKQVAMNLMRAELGLCRQ
jgi:hypothetical protein